MSKILIACEESQTVCKAFRALGHEAYSCDIIDTSGENPEWHFKIDALKAMHQRFWDLIIVFPPCTDLAISGARWFPEKRANGNQQLSIEFFMDFIKFQKLDGCKMAIENPIGIMSSLYRKPDQIIQPWQFGHGETKAICLWLFGLPKLIPTSIVEGREGRIWKMPPGPERAKMRSKTYDGIAQGMVNKWSPLL